MRHPPLLRPLLLLFLLMSAPAGATVYLPADFAEMVTASRLVVHGTVVDVRSEPTPDRRSIATQVTVDVAEALKGTPGESVTFRVPGGQVGRYRRIVVGAPEFERGDEVVLFLTARGPSIPYVFGLSQGVYRVSRATGGPVVNPPPVVSRDPLSLDQFAREVRAIVERRR